MLRERNNYQKQYVMLSRTGVAAITCLTYIGSVPIYLIFTRNQYQLVCTLINA